MPNEMMDQCRRRVDPDDDEDRIRYSLVYIFDLLFQQFVTWIECGNLE